MADYKDHYDFRDESHRPGFGPVPAVSPHDIGAPTKTSRVQKKVTQVIVFDFGPGPYKVDDFRDWAKELDELPTGAKVQPEYHSDQNGSTLKFTVTTG